MVNSKNAFWQALVFAVIIFAVGISLGVFFENGRSRSMELNAMHSEVNLLDEQLRERLIADLPLECGLARNNTLEFADRIYYEAKQLEDYDDARTLSQDLIVIHKRYDILRLMVWLEAREIEDRCDTNMNSIVYLYQYESSDLNVIAEQRTMANLLLEVKNEYKDKVILLPMATNLNISSVDAVVKNYNITQYPSVIINGKVLSGIVSKQEIVNVVF